MGNGATVSKQSGLYFLPFVHNHSLTYIHKIYIYAFLLVKKFNATYMLARELGSGAFSVVRLGIHKVFILSMHIYLPLIE
jgi:hypothetical protein